MCNKNYGQAGKQRQINRLVSVSQTAVWSRKAVQAVSPLFGGLSKRKLGRAPLACPYAIATGVSSSLRATLRLCKPFRNHKRYTFRYTN